MNEQRKADLTFRSLWSGLRERLSGERGRRWLFLMGVIGIALLALSEFLPAKTETAAAETASAADFVKQTEERLTALVSRIEGAGECCVLVTLENGVEYVYATEQKSNTDRQEDTDGSGTRLTERDDTESAAIVVDTGNGRTGLLVTELQPTVRGVVVVCEGGDREEVRRRIIEAVTVAMDLSSKRVCVTKLT